VPIVFIRNIDISQVLIENRNIHSQNDALNLFPGSKSKRFFWNRASHIMSNNMNKKVET